MGAWAGFWVASVHASTHPRRCVCQKLGWSWAQHPCVDMAYWSEWLEPTRNGKEEAKAKAKGKLANKNPPPDEEPADPIEDEPADAGDDDALSGDA